MRRNSKVNNKGFSLVELIVTIAILAIVVAPLLNAFVISARTNAKAREKLYVTTIAENLMEGIEQLSLDELAYQFNYPNQAFDLVTSSNISKVPGAEGEEASIPAMELTLEKKNDGGEMTYSYAPALTIEDVRRLYPTLTNPQDLVSASVVSGAAGDYTFVGQNSHKYYFLLNNLSTGTSGGSSTKEYSALISENDNVEILFDIPKSIDAPVCKNEEVGTLVLKINNEEVWTTSVYISEDVMENTYKYHVNMNPS